MGTFLPFSQEVNPQITTNHYKFTGDEHDAESNLEHTQFRQLSTTQGRWLSPDSYLGSMDLTNPTFRANMKSFDVARFERDYLNDLLQSCHSFLHSRIGFRD